MKIKKELKEFCEFKNKYFFKPLELTYKDDKIYYKDYIVSENGETLNESEDFINVGYKLKGARSKILSNLFPYQFRFKGVKVASIESVFQGIKFKDKKAQKLVLKYAGLDANNVKACNIDDWKISGELYWRGKKLNRFSQEYDDFVKELYISAIQNPLYRQALVTTDKYVLHSIGGLDKKETVFTRFEFEEMINTLISFLKKKI